jgi:hypothetical protein
MVIMDKDDMEVSSEMLPNDWFIVDH